MRTPPRGWRLAARHQPLQLRHMEVHFGVFADLAHDLWQQMEEDRCAIDRLHALHNELARPLLLDSAQVVVGHRGVEHSVEQFSDGSVPAREAREGEGLLRTTSRSPRFSMCCSATGPSSARPGPIRRAKRSPRWPSRSTTSCGRRCLATSPRAGCRSGQCRSSLRAWRTALHHRPAHQPPTRHPSSLSQSTPRSTSARPPRRLCPSTRCAAAPAGLTRAAGESTSVG